MNNADNQSIGFPIEEVAVFPPPGMATPGTFRFSLDGRRLMYLATGEGDNVQMLYVMDVVTGEKKLLVEPPGGGVQEANLTPEEELRRQRLRMLSVGITQFSRARESDRLVIPLNGDIYVYDDDGLRNIVDTSDKPPALNPALSPDGEYVAYVQDAEVYVIPASGGTPVQITRGARGTGKTHGLAEYIAQEELGRGEGFWWSPDSRRIVFAQVDETHIPVYRIMHQGKDETGDSAQEEHRYPFTGAQNAIVSLAVVPLEGGDPVWLDLDTGEEIYVARVFWWPDGSPGAELLNRAQTHLDLVRFDIATGGRASVLAEQSDYWVNMRTGHFKLLKDSSFIWASERTGYNHLYHYNRDGTLIRVLTAGTWAVDDIAGVDETRGIIYFTAGRENPTEIHLYAVSLTGGEIRRITIEPGQHFVWLDQAGDHFVDLHSALDQPPQVSLQALADGAHIHMIHTCSDPRVEQFDLTSPEIVTLKNREDETLYGAIYRPPEHFGPGPHPTIVHVYGGPGPQMVADHWRTTAAMQLQYLRNQGFLVFRLDNRGSARRGLQFEGALKHRMGTIEVDDQVDGVRWLVEQGLADPDRVGVTGWSYGGYMTLMCLAKAPEVFKVGVSGAPVTDWDGYDTCYTERYMSTPQQNPEGYAIGSVLKFTNQITGKLLIIHGMLDENVHFRHTARLINALNRARRQYDLLIFPDERHMPRRLADRVYLNERLVQYFQAYL